MDDVLLIQLAGADRFYVTSTYVLHTPINKRPDDLLNAYTNEND